MTVSETNDSIRITGVCGSLSADGVTKKALAIALKGASEYNAETALLELRDFNLVFYGSVPQDEYPPDVIQLRQALKDSQGIILATPEYHGSLTGALNSLNTMKTICRNLHCWVLPQEVSIANSAQTFNDDGTVKDPEIEERLLNVGRQLVKFASVQQRVQQDEFMKMWKSLPTW
jgi:FMN reductase